MLTSQPENSRLLPTDPPSGGQLGPDEISIIDVLAVVLPRWRVMLLTSTVLLGLVVFGTFVRGARYTVSSSFLVQGGSASSAANGLAARFGVVLPQNDPGQSPGFYASLARTQEILRTLVVATYPVSDGGDRKTLVDLFESDGAAGEQRIENAIRDLRDAIRVTVQEETGEVQVAVTTRWPSVSLGISARLLEELDRFNVERRQRVAAAEEEFTKQRVLEAEEAVRAIEDSLQLFLQRNRQFQNSPELLFVHDRLTSRVALRQAVFTGLVQSLDNARLEAVRNTPLLTVVEPPRMPVQPDRRFLLAKGLLAIVIGLVVSIASVLFTSAFRTAVAANPGAAARIRALWPRKSATNGPA